MATDPPDHGEDADWLQPPTEHEGLRRYVQTVAARKWLILLVMLITTGAAVAYVLTATKIYEAEADLLVTPVSPDDSVASSLGLLRESVDPVRDVETAARLVTNLPVAEEVRKQLNTSESARSLLEKVDAQPVAQSSIVAITAEGDSPEEARDLANAFARQTVADRTQKLHQRVEDLIERVEAEIGSSPGGDASLNEDLAQLEILRRAPDPTIRVETAAQLPEDPVSPRPALSIGAGLLGGLVLGLLAAFGSEALDARLRREAQLRALYRLPVLGRIPRERVFRDRSAPLGPERLSPAAAESYRTLRATLTAETRSDAGSRVILVTGPGPSSGKSTTAVNLASSLAMAGKQTLLIEADLRRPSLARALGLKPTEGGVASVLVEETKLRDAVTPVPVHGGRLDALLAEESNGLSTVELFFGTHGRRLIDEACRNADYVVIDSPPLNEVVDALPLAEQADDVLIVVRLGRTRLDKTMELAELLADNQIRPAGFAVIGVPKPRRSEYHYYRSTPLSRSESVASGSGSKRAPRRTRRSASDKA